MHLLDISYYDADNMTAEKCNEFLLWYEENRHCAFDLQCELLLYCRSDVGILLKACLKFYKLYKEITGPEYPVDPVFDQ